MNSEAVEMFKGFRRWFYRDAEWWEFWFPQSGPIGGVLFCMAFWLAVFVVWEAMQ